MSEKSYFDNNGEETKKEQTGSYGIFSSLYRTRVKINKADTPIINLSLLFMILATISAPWIVIIGVIVALVLGYRFSIEKNAQGFSDNFQDIVNDAAGNVRAAVDSVVKDEDKE
ncbi:MAG: DUF4342 domain-containing protein [Clostridiales bacterium]|nr:DUF4342 domain-containing protein [Clostridiales bacterium]